MPSIHRLARVSRGCAVAAGLLLALPTCGRQVTDAGVKQIGVGVEPGVIQSNPEGRGGLIDYALIELRGKWLDLGSTITGLYGSSEAFTTAEDPTRVVLGFSYLFNPPLTAVDELSLISPKGPDTPDTCFPLINNVGPLGSFTTIDVGDSVVLRDKATTGTAARFQLDRTPLDYPERTSDVFIYYLGSQAYLSQEYIAADPHGWAPKYLTANWAFDTEYELYFGGGIPPEDAPVDSIPLPSDVADDRVFKAAGNPEVTTPPELTGLLVSTRGDATGGIPVEFDARSDGLPSPWDGTGQGEDLLHVQWEGLCAEGDAECASETLVTLSVRLLGRVPGAGGVPCPDDPTQECACTVYGEDSLGNALDDCDPDYAAARQSIDEGILDGREAFGASVADAPDCSDGIDNDADGGCDSYGCTDPLTGQFLMPDYECPRKYPISRCDAETGTCQPSGGSRDGDGFVGELVCTAADDGDFVIDAEDLASLAAKVDLSEVVGAILIVNRSRESLIQVPTVRNATGGANDVNDIRLRASHMVVGRLAVAGGP